MLYSVDVKAFINVLVEADNEDQALERAEHFVGWTSPTPEQIEDYNSDHDPIEDAYGFDIDSESDVEEVSDA